jgi:hypothetical protein
MIEKLKVSIKIISPLNTDPTQRLEKSSEFTYVNEKQKISAT